MRVEEHDDKEPMSEEEIDETLDESFPASDPPSWSLGTNHGSGKMKADNDDETSGGA